jgi:hypothetical protein
VKKLLLYICISILLIVGCVILRNIASPESTVKSVIEKVRSGDLQNLQMKQNDIRLIWSYFEFADVNHLAPLEVQVRKVAENNDDAQVMATFQAIDYGEDNKIRGVYGGSLTFTLHKTSFASWDIVEVDEKEKMRKKDT